MKRKNHSAFAMKVHALSCHIYCSLDYTSLVFYPIVVLLYTNTVLHSKMVIIRMIIKSNSNAVREIIEALLRE